MRSAYTLMAVTGGFQITANAGTDGVDALANVERLQFADATVALDVGPTGIGGQVFRLYQAAFNRAPDLGGLGFWINAMDNGVSLQDVLGGMVMSKEYTDTYTGLSNFDLVTRFYENMLGRTPEAAGRDYWVGALDANLITVPQGLSFISASQEFQDRMAVVIGNGFTYTPFQGYARHLRPRRRRASVAPQHDGP